MRYTSAAGLIYCGGDTVSGERMDILNIRKIQCPYGIIVTRTDGGLSVYVLYDDQIVALPFPKHSTFPDENRIDQKDVERSKGYDKLLNGMLRHLL